MKTLHASGALRLCLAFSSVPGVILILLGINAFGEGNMDEGIFHIIGAILFILLGVFAGFRIYRTHWIRYGDGKVTIRRVSKERVKGRPVGKWKTGKIRFCWKK